MFRFCKEFCKNSSVHGLELVVSERNSVKERVFWGCLIGIATILLCQKVYSLGKLVTHSNVELIVDNPNYRLENVDFPAVTICSNSKVMKTKLYRYIKYLRLIRKKQISEEKFVKSVLALDHMKYPFLHHPALFVERFNNNVIHIPNEEIFNIMMLVNPKLNQMITNCRWRGRVMLCNELFRKQITEEGFCYSFNSKTADRSLDELPRMPPEELADGSLECLRNNAAGRVSGLSFVLKSHDQELLENNLQTRGYSIMVHNPNSFPEVIDKFLVFWKNFTFSRINVLVTTVRTDKSFSLITESARGCRMGTLDTNSCFLRCRQKEILKRCDCLPYYMYLFNRYAETCGMQHLKCLSENNKRFRNPHVVGEDYKIPAWSQPLTMDCKCQLPCSSTSYTSEYTFIPMQEVIGNNLGFVEVAYKTNYATSYIRRARFTFSDFLVDIGSLAGLFLGCSIITLIELFIFIYKFASEVYFVTFVKRTVIRPFVK